MTEREKLAEKLTAIIANMPNSVDCIVSQAEYIADHLLADDEIIVPPCKVGDITYIFDYEVNNHLESKLRGVAPSIVEAIVIEDEGVWVENEHAKYHITAFGDIIFLTKEEAERALKERSEGK